MSENEATLWREYRLTGDHYFRDRLIERYLRYARSLARKKLLPRYVDREEMEGAAIIGLIQAVDRYDPEQSISFMSFAWHRIEGAMQDSLRQINRWSRSLKRNRRELELFEGMYRSPRNNPTARLEREESFERFRRLFCCDDREREIVHLYYREGHPLHAVGAHLGISESRVCQIINRLLSRTKKTRRRAGPAAEIRDAYARGMRWGEIIRRYGISRSHLWKVTQGLRRVAPGGQRARRLSKCR